VHFFLCGPGAASICPEHDEDFTRIRYFFPTAQATFFELPTSLVLRAKKRQEAASSPIDVPLFHETGFDPSAEDAANLQQLNLTCTIGQTPTINLSRSLWGTFSQTSESGLTTGPDLEKL
jgi:hypothetical protein